MLNQTEPQGRSDYTAVRKEEQIVSLLLMEPGMIHY